MRRPSMLAAMVAWNALVIVVAAITVPASTPPRFAYAVGVFGGLVTGWMASRWLLPSRRVQTSRAEIVVTADTTQAKAAIREITRDVEHLASKLREVVR